MRPGKNAIYILAGKRTQIGKPHRALKKMKAVDLAAAVIDGVLENASVNRINVDQVFVGNTLSAGLGQNFAREAVSLSSLPITVPAMVVDNVCGSGFEALIVARDSLLSQRNRCVVCAGAESITHTPFLLPPEKKENFQEEDFQDGLVQDGLFCSLSKKLMGQIADQLAFKQNLSREAQDEVAFLSHKKALEAMERGYLSHEIIPLGEKKNDQYVDECIRKRISLERLASLPPAFEEEGTVTAGNSSRICDGAAAIMLADEAMVHEQKLSPQAQILAVSNIANDPGNAYAFGQDAITQCLDAAGLTLKDVDLFEICEAFASQIVYLQEVLKFDPLKMNVFGGDIAIGHPMGASGLRALVTLMNALTIQDKEIGLACVSFGGGGSIAVLIKRVKE